MFRIIVDERRKREADPDAGDAARGGQPRREKPGAADAYTRERLADMLQFFELMNELGRADRRAADAGGDPDGQDGRQGRQAARR